MSVIIYANTHGGNGDRPWNALATMMLLFLLRGRHRRPRRLPMDDAR